MYWMYSIDNNRFISLVYVVYFLSIESLKRKKFVINYLKLNQIFL